MLEKRAASPTLMKLQEIGLEIKSPGSKVGTQNFPRGAKPMALVLPRDGMGRLAEPSRGEGPSARGGRSDAQYWVRVCVLLPSCSPAHHTACRHDAFSSAEEGSTLSRDVGLAIP